MNSVNTSGKNFMPSLPAVLLYRVGDELVGQFGDRLHPARHQRARPSCRRPAARRDADHGDHHEQRGIGEGDLVPADVAERDDLVDFELMDRIGHGRSVSFGALTPRAAPRRSNPSDARSSSPERPPDTTPAARITLSTPAAKPSKRNTIIPHGEIPSHRSSSQPMNAPTSTPATSSVESRKPRASADGSVAGRDAEPLRMRGARLVWSSRSPRLLEPRGESGLVGRRFPLPRLRVLSDIVDTREVEEIPGFRRPSKPRGPY